jgi:hypothetical protein
MDYAWISEFVEAVASDIQTHQCTKNIIRRVIHQYTFDYVTETANKVEYIAP